MPEVVGTIRVVHVWGGAGAGAAGAGRATMIAAGGGAAAGGLVGASAAGGGGLLAGGAISSRAGLGRMMAGLRPAEQRMLAQWKPSTGSTQSAFFKTATPLGSFGWRDTGNYLKSRGGFLGFGGLRTRWRAENAAKLQAANRGWDPTAGPQPQYTTSNMTLGQFGQRLGNMAKRGVKGLSQIGKWFSGAGLTPQKLSSIGKFFKTIGERTGLSGGALGGLVRQVGAIGPAGLIIALAGKGLRDVGRARERAGAFQQRLAATHGLGTGYAASQVLTQERQARYAVEVAGRGTYAGERGLLQQRWIRERTRRRPGHLARWWAETAADLSMGGTRVKSWFYRDPDPAIEKARRLHNRRWMAGEVPKSWEATRDELRLREDPYYRALEEAKELRPDLFGGSKRGFIPVSGQYGLAGATATATATQLSKEDLQNERDRIIYSIQLSQGLGP